MPTEALVQAFLVGRDAYLTTTLAYQGVLDQDTAQLRFQIAEVDSQVWTDWLTVDATGTVDIPSLTSSGLLVDWSQVTGTPTTLAGYGVTSPLTVGEGGTGTSTAFTAGSVVFAGASGVYAQDNANLFWDDTNNRLGIGLGATAPRTKLDVAGGVNFNGPGAASAI